jgi:hypothetical chaperone protein
VGRPVNFECHSGQEQEECNTLAMERMVRALEHAEVRDYSFFLEPIAPVLSYSHGKDDEPDEHVLVLDFGGGTLDFSLVRRTAKRLHVVGSFGRALGGDIITEKLIGDYVFPRMGITSGNLTKLRKERIYLGEMRPYILNWRTTYALNQPQYLMQIAAAMRLLPQEAEKLNRIRLLVVRNFSYNVFDAVDTAKRELSSTPHAEINLEPIGVSFAISRRELERSMQGYLDVVQTSIERFCSECHCDAAEVGRVLLTGGTSLIPCVRQRIEGLFPDRVEAIDPFLSIVRGFALGAWLQRQGKVRLSGDEMEIDVA